MRHKAPLVQQDGGEICPICTKEMLNDLWADIKPPINNFDGADRLERAAEAWEELKLPAFEVPFQLEGKTQMRTVVQMLRIAAERLRLGEGTY